jgi:predicted metal-binding protein
MKQVAIVGCGAYMSSGYGCPGEWRCLKSAAEGAGKFAEPVQVVAFVRCECPGRSAPPNLGLALKMADAKVEAVHLSSCLANAKPVCPYFSADELARILQEKTGLPVMLGTHEYH